MTDTFATRLAEKSVGLFYFVRITGIPILYCAGAVPPSFVTGYRAWGGAYSTFQGQQYDWSETLLLDESWGSVGQLAQPKGGMPTAGGLPFRFRSDDRVDGNLTKPEALWRKLMQFNLRSSDRKTANLREDIAAGQTSGDLVFLSNPWNGVSGNLVLHIGTEAIVVDDATDTATERGGIVTRGAYGSTPKYHEASSRTEDESHATGLIVSDSPYAWERRVVELFAVVGEWVNIDLPTNAHLGQFTPFCRLNGGLDPLFDEPNMKCLYRGLLTNVRQGGDHASIAIETAGLPAMIQQEIIERTPTAKVGLGQGVGWSADGGLNKVYIDSHNWRFSLTVRSDVLYVPLSVVCVDWASVSDGDVLQFAYPGGTRTFTARTAPATATEFGIGSDAEDLIDNLKGVLGADSTWRTHYGWEADPQNLPWMLRFVFRSPQDAATGAYALTSSNTGALQFSQADTSPVALQMLNKRLRRWNVSAYEDVPVGLYSPGELGNYLTDSVKEHMESLGLIPGGSGAAWHPLRPSVYINRERPADGSWSNKIILGFNFPMITARGTAVDWFTRYSSLESFLRDLGFVEDAYFGQNTDEETPWIEITADKAPAAFRWPSRLYAAPPRLYLNGMQQWDLENMIATYLHFDDVGTGLCHGIIDGVDIVAMSEGSFSEWAGPYLDSGFYVLVDERNHFAWGNQDEVYVEVENPLGDKEQKEIKFERCVLFRNGIGVTKAILQLLCGGSGSEGTLDATYDVGWRGCGLAINGDYIDIASFEAFSDFGFEKRYFCIRKGDSIEDLLNNECKLGQFQICAGLGQLYLIDTKPMLEGDAASAHVLDHSISVTDLANQGSGFDTSENRVLNHITGRGNYNPVTKSYGTTSINLYRADSIASFGKKEPMQVNIMGVPGIIATQAQSSRLGSRVFGAYAYRYAVIEKYIATPAAWLWRLGDTVLLTARELPGLDADEVGVEALPCKIFGKDDYFLTGGSDRGRYFCKVVLVCRAYSGFRFGRWCPTAYAATYKGGGGSGAAVVTTSTLYARSGNDAASFMAGWKVRLYSIVDGSTVDRVVYGVIGNEIEFTVSTSIALPALVMFAPYDDIEVGGEQSKHVYLSDGLDVGAADDKPYYYP